MKGCLSCCARMGIEVCEEEIRRQRKTGDARRLELIEDVGRSGVSGHGGDHVGNYSSRHSN